MVTSTTHFPISPNAALTRTRLMREAAISELGLPKREEYQTSPELLSAVAELIAGRITAAIKDAEAKGLGLAATKKVIRQASEFAGEMLLSGTSLNKRALPNLLSSALDISGWHERIEGELRSRLVLGEPSREHVQEVLQTLLASEDLRDMLKGLDGYRWVADTLCEGRMDKSYKLMSAACKFAGRKFSELEWEAAFMGTTKRFDELCEALTTDRDQYRELKGYRIFSERWANGDMLKGYILMSAACKLTGRTFSELGWEALFHGTTKRFDELCEALSTDWDQYRELKGYRIFSESWANGDMLKGYILMSAACKFTGRTFSELEWEALFKGTTQRFDELCEALTTDWDQYRELKGYRIFSESWADGDMLKGYTLMSATCKFTGRKFSELWWEAQFHGTTKRFDELCEALSTDWDQYRELKGYRIFSERWAEADMQKGYILMSAACKYAGRDFCSLAWPPGFAGTVEQHNAIESFVLDRANVAHIQALLKQPKAERMDRLKGLVGEVNVNSSIQDLSSRAILAALPELISDRIGRRDFFVEGDGEEFDVGE